MMKKVLMGVAVLLAGLFGLILLQPNEYVVQRSVTVAAGPEVLFPLVNDLHHWKQWSPFDKLDPEMKTTFTGSPYGAGAKYHWEGNDKAGEGKMTIVDSRPTELVDIKLEFIKPFPGMSDTLFTFVPASPGTTVTWKMTAQNSLLGKAAGLFMNMDKFLGPQFESGLGAMKSLAEAEAKKRADMAAAEREAEKTHGVPAPVPPQ